MAVDNVIDPTQALYTIVAILAAFVPVFTNKTMWNYWSDVYFPQSYLAKENKTTPADDETKKAQVVATSKRSSVMYWAVIPVLDLISKALNAATIYQIIRVYGLVGDANNYTIMFSMLVATIGLDKGLPAAANWFAYESWFWVAFVYGFISWGMTVSTLAVLFVYSNTVVAGCLFLGYSVFNTVFNVTAWISFWGADSYKVSAAQVAAGRLGMQNPRSQLHV